MIAETLLPLMVVALMAVLVPEGLASPHSLSQRRLGGAMGVSALVIFLAGVVLMVALYGWQGSRVGQGLAAYPWTTARYFLAASLWLVPFWIPLLALVWLVKAQALEARRGRVAAAGGRG